MKMKKLILVLLLVASVAAVACSSAKSTDTNTGTGTDTDTPPVVTPAEPELVDLTHFDWETVPLTPEQAAFIDGLVGSESDYGTPTQYNGIPTPTYHSVRSMFIKYAFFYDCWTMECVGPVMTAVYEGKSNPSYPCRSEEEVAKIVTALLNNK